MSTCVIFSSLVWGFLCDALPVLIKEIYKEPSFYLIYIRKVNKEFGNRMKGKARPLIILTHNFYYFNLICTCVTTQESGASKQYLNANQFCQKFHKLLLIFIQFLNMPVFNISYIVQVFYFYNSHPIKLALALPIRISSMKLLQHHNGLLLS